jgi:hypothetical protein
MTMQIELLPVMERAGERSGGDGRETQWCNRVQGPACLAKPNRKVVDWAENGGPRHEDFRSCRVTSKTIM